MHREGALTRQRDRQIAIDLGISESCLRHLMDQADVDDGTREGLTSLRPLLLRDTRQHQADGCPLIERVEAHHAHAELRAATGFG